MNKVKSESKYATADGFAYLDKRTVVRKAQAAGRKAAKSAMLTMGYVVTAQNGQIVKKFIDGSFEVLGNFQRVEIPKNINLG